MVCLNSATAAEELNLRILGIGEGDEVLVPAYTYTASAVLSITYSTDYFVEYTEGRNSYPISFFPHFLYTLHYG